MLRPKGSWGACTPHGIIHSSTVLHGADLYTLRSYHIPPSCFTAQLVLQPLSYTSAVGRPSGCGDVVRKATSSLTERKHPQAFALATPVQQGMERRASGLTDR
jgi:hypothetical protein